jgi:hypothetical protein
MKLKGRRKVSDNIVKVLLFIVVINISGHFIVCRKAVEFYKVR